MTDPFSALHQPIEPTDPDPAFAAALRDRVHRVLQIEQGASMANITAHSGSGRPGAPAARIDALLPYIAVDGAAQAIEWYGEAFGAQLTGPPIVMPDDRIGHAELAFGELVLMISDAYPEIGVVAPTSQGTAVTLYLGVDDVDAVMARASDAGAEVARAAADYPYGRNGVLRDPFGHRWMISGPVVGDG